MIYSASTGNHVSSPSKYRMGEYCTAKSTSAAEPLKGTITIIDKTSISPMKPIFTLLKAIHSPDF